jgi:hypothetical protein
MLASALPTIALVSGSVLIGVVVDVSRPVLIDSGINLFIVLFV